LADYSPLYLWVPLYLLLIFAAKLLVCVRGKPYGLKQVVIVHNWLLAALSAWLFVALGTELIIQISRHGFWAVFCQEFVKFTVGKLPLFYYINYLFKYYELLDTLLLALRGKPTPFLHTYHHAATLILCWSQLRAGSCVQWVPIIINLGIHVVMYSYYAMHAMGKTVWWKKYLTLCQIIQFVVGLIGCFGGLLPRTLHDLGYSDTFSKCHGEYSASFFGIGIIFTYLVLFVRMYRSEAYKKRTEAALRAKKEKEAAGKQQ